MSELVRREAVRLQTLRAIERMQALGGRTTLSDIMVDVVTHLGDTVDDREVDRALQHFRRGGAIRFGRDGWRIAAKATLTPKDPTHD